MAAIKLDQAPVLLPDSGVDGSVVPLSELSTAQQHLQFAISAQHYLSGTFEQPVLNPDDGKQPVLLVQSERHKLAQPVALKNAVWSKLDQLGGKVKLEPPVEISRPDLLEDSMALADALAGGGSLEAMESVLSASGLKPEDIQVVKQQALELLGVSDRQIEQYAAAYGEGSKSDPEAAKDLQFGLLSPAVRMRSQLSVQNGDGRAALGDVDAAMARGLKGSLGEEKGTQAHKDLQALQFNGRADEGEPVESGAQLLAQTQPLSPMGPRAVAKLLDDYDVPTVLANLASWGLTPQEALDAVDRALAFAGVGPSSPKENQANGYLSQTIAQFGNPLPSEYLTYAMAARGAVVDPHALSDAEKSKLQEFIKVFGEKGFEGLSDEQKAWAQTAASAFLVTDRDQFEGSTLGMKEGGLTQEEVVAGVVELQKRVASESGLQTPDIPAKNLDYQSLLVGGEDSDRQNAFLWNSVANQIKLQKQGDLGLTDKQGTVYVPHAMVQVWSPDGLPPPPSNEPLTQEEQAFVAQWVQAHGPITEDNRTELSKALAEKFGNIWNTRTFYVDAIPDPWVGQRENVGVLQDAQTQAYRSWSASGKAVMDSPDNLAKKLQTQLQKSAGPEGLAALLPGDAQHPAQGSGLNTWLQRLQDNGAKIMSPLQVDSPEIKGVGGFFAKLTGLPAAIYETKHPVHYSDAQQDVVDLLNHQGRESKGLEGAMAQAEKDRKEEIVGDWFNFALNAGMAVVTAGAAGVSELSAALEAGELSAGRVAMIGGQGAVDVLKGVFDPLCLIDIASGGAQLSVRAMEQLSEHLTAMFKGLGPQGEALAEQMSGLIDHAHGVSDVSSLAPEMREILAAAKPLKLNAEQSAVVGQIEETLQNITAAKTAEQQLSNPPLWALDEGKRAELDWGSDGVAGVTLSDGPHQVIKTESGEMLVGQRDGNTGRFNVLDTQGHVREVYVRGEGDAWRPMGSRLKQSPSTLSSSELEGVKWATAGETWGSVNLGGKSFDVVKTGDGQVIIGKQKGNSAFEAQDREGKYLGTYVRAEDGLYRQGRLPGGGQRFSAPSSAVVEDAHLEEESLEDPFSDLPDDVLRKIYGKVDPEAQKALMSSSKRLRDLLKGEVPSLIVSGENLAKAIETFPNAERIKLTGEVTAEQIKALTQAKKLKSLDLSNCHVSDAVLESMSQIEGLQGLESLDLSHSPEVTDAGLAHLKRFSNLTSLNLAGCLEITDAGIRHLESFKHLSSLNLFNLAKITDQGFGVLRGLQNLTSLNLAFCRQLTDVGLQTLEGLTGLVTLNLDGLNQITDEGLGALADLRQLKSLSLYGLNRITGVGLGAMRGLESLISLDLSLCLGITDEGLRSLAGFENLTFLDLAYCRQITDDGLRFLEGHKNLNLLDLSFCGQITGVGISSLQSLENLTSLTVRGLMNQSNAEAIVTLKARMPNLHISC